MTRYSENGLNRFILGSLSSMIAILFVVAIAFFIQHNNQSVGKWEMTTMLFDYTPWLLVGGLSSFFGTLSALPQSAYKGIADVMSGAVDIFSIIGEFFSSGS